MHLLYCHSYLFFHTFQIPHCSAKPGLGPKMQRGKQSSACWNLQLNLNGRAGSFLSDSLMSCGAKGHRLINTLW